MRCDGSTLTSSRASLMALVPIGRGGLEQEGLLKDQLVVGILGERSRIEVCCRGGIVVAARHAPGEIIAEQSAGPSLSVTVEATSE